MKEKYIVVRATEEFKQRVKKMAIRDNKTLSGYVSDLLLDDIKKREQNDRIRLDKD